MGGGAIVYVQQRAWGWCITVKIAGTRTYYIGTLHREVHVRAWTRYLRCRIDAGEIDVPGWIAQIRVFSRKQKRWQRMQVGQPVRSERRAQLTVHVRGENVYVGRFDSREALVAVRRAAYREIRAGTFDRDRFREEHGLVQRRSHRRPRAPRIGRPAAAVAAEEKRSGPPPPRPVEPSKRLSEPPVRCARSRRRGRPPGPKGRSDREGPCDGCGDPAWLTWFRRRYLCRACLCRPDPEADRALGVALRTGRSALGEKMDIG